MAARYVFLGPPGAGKGTQAVVASEKCGVPAVSTGLIFKAAINEETTMGRQVAQFVNSGLSVPDKLANAVVAERLQEKDCKKGFILDGYPKSLMQARSLDTFLQKAKLSLETVLFFDVSAEVAVGRIGQRRASERLTRPEDQPDAIRKRFEAYQKTTEPLLLHYEKKGILKRVNASLPVTEVTKNVLTLLGHV